MPRKKEPDTLTLSEQVQEILARAQDKGLQTNFFFITTFKRYQVQIQIMSELEKAIKEDGALVTKEYVKGRKNVYTNPAITEYNKTATAANQTVATLLKIVEGFPEIDKEAAQGTGSKLEALIKELQRNG